ncbi:immunoglobulin i-set domain-containing protein [Phthorimaea operculella]|nr:immunoglobulin i-set domain-containing protein [Phthorimaea operculella]
MDFLEKWSFTLLIAVLASLVKESHTACKIDVNGQSLYAVGTNLYVTCECDESIEEVKWVGPDGRVIEEEKSGRERRVYAVHPMPGMVTLYINDLTERIGGQYKCVYTGSDNKEVALSHEIIAFKHLTWSNTTLPEQYITEGEDSLIICRAEGYKELSNLLWYRYYDTELVDVQKYEIKDEGLLIKKATKEDIGTYRCVALSPLIGDQKDLIITVELRSAPHNINLSASDQEVMIGEAVAIVCVADGNPLPTFSWKKYTSEDTSVFSTVGYNVTNETTSPDEAQPYESLGRLVIPNVTMRDHGIYECTAHNGVGKEAKENITITVLSPPMITDFKNITADEGSPVSIICEAIGSPRPGIDIIGHRTNQSQPNYHIDEKSFWTLINVSFEKIHRDHAGEYACNVSNSVGSDEATMNLEVLYKPSFEVSHETIWTWDDAMVNLTCDHDSQPTATVRWSFNGNEKIESYLNNDTIKENIRSLRTMLSENADETYVLLAPEEYYLGKYECIAENHLGNAKKTFAVKEGLVPEKVSLDQVNITDIAATSVIFHIQYAHSTEIPPTIGYTAEYDKEDNYNITDIHLNRTWALNVPYKIDRLEPITQYRIRFAAVNMVGTGPYSEYFGFVTPEKSAPEPPSWSEHSGPILISNENKILKLISPEHNGDPIDYFAIKYCREDDPENCIEQLIPPTTELKLNHLRPNTSYTIEMVAHNSVGNSTPVSLQIILEEDPPQLSLLTSEAIIGIAVIVIIICIVIVDVILFVTMKKGMIAACVHKNKKLGASKLLRDKKGLLKDKTASTEHEKRPDKEHKEFQYNKSTGIITGKHSAV